MSVITKTRRYEILTNEFDTWEVRERGQFGIRTCYYRAVSDNSGFQFAGEPEFVLSAGQTIARTVKGDWRKSNTWKVLMAGRVLAEGEPTDVVIY